jgi:hypothetical protein
MAKVVFLVSLIYFVVDGVRAWLAVFAGDHASVGAMSNTAGFFGVIALISLLVIAKGNADK